MLVVIRVFVAVALLSAFARAAGPTLVVELPDGSKVKEAVATAPSMKLDTKGAADGRTITFANLLPDTPYTVKVTLADGTILCGADLTWYNDEPAKADAGELTDDDRKEVNALVSEVRQFYDRSEIILLQADHDRAVALVQQIRDSAFHSDKGGEVIWRIETWYFKFRAGGWERISQTNKVLRRERYASKAAYTAETQKLRWVAELGGIRIPKDQASLTVKLPQKGPASAPAKAP